MFLNIHPELTEDIFVAHKGRLVNLRFSEPAGLLGGEEHFGRHVLSPPLGQPHLAVAAFADGLDHLQLLGDGALHQQRKS